MGKITTGSIVASKKSGNGFSVVAAKEGKTKRSRHTYSARIERVIDGDTLLVVVDCGFRTRTRQKLRLRGIDAPEMNTAEGERVKRYVQRVFRAIPVIVIKTYSTDKYDRYLSDVFYLSGEPDPAVIASRGNFLNQELLDKRLVLEY